MFPAGRSGWWRGQARPGLAWPGLAWPGHARPGQAWRCQAWPGLAKLGLALSCGLRCEAYWGVAPFDIREIVSSGHGTSQRVPGQSLVTLRLHTTCSKWWMTLLFYNKSSETPPLWKGKCRGDIPGNSRCLPDITIPSFQTFEGAMVPTGQPLTLLPTLKP